MLTPNQDAIVAACPDEELVFMDGFDSALLGVAWQFNTPIVVYKRSLCIEVLMERDGITEDEADEFFDFNCQGSYVGPRTPCILTDLPSIFQWATGEGVG